MTRDESKQMVLHVLQVLVTVNAELRIPIGSVELMHLMSNNKCKTGRLAICTVSQKAGGPRCWLVCIG